MSDEIRIYVADLAAYNTGHLHDVWINACDELDDIKAQINEMLAASRKILPKNTPFMIMRASVDMY